jgi:cell division protein FtsW
MSPRTLEQERATVTSLTERRRRNGVESLDPDVRDHRRGGRRPVASRPPGRRSSLFLTLFAIVAVLNLIGLSMILSASSVTSLEDNGSPWYQFLRQLVWFVMGAIAMVVTMRTDYHRWRKHCGYGVIAVVVLLTLVFVPRIGVGGNGAQRWLGWGTLSIQPSEFAKLALVVFWADLLARRSKWIEDIRLTLVPVALSFGIIGALIMKQPNLGTTTIIFVIMVTMLFVGGAPMRWLAGILGAGAVAAAGFARLSPWRWNRIMAFRDPWADPRNTGYQPLEAQIAVADGGITGVGLGQSRAKWKFLPEADTDFIFSIIAEEAGLLGALLVIGLFVALAVTGTVVAMRAKDRYGMLIAAGITSWFLSQAFLNIGQSVGALPVMGVPLPFVSSGGSSLVVNLIAVGMLLNVARQAS